MTQNIGITTFDGKWANLVETQHGTWIIITKLSSRPQVEPYTHYLSREKTWESGCSDRYASEAEAREHATTPPVATPEATKTGLDLEKLETKREAARRDKVDLFDFYHENWDAVIAEIESLRALPRHRILTEFREAADGQSFEYVEGLTVCHKNDIDGG